MARLRALRSPRQRNLYKRRVIRLVLAWIVAVASVVAATVLFLNASFVRITAVSVQGGTTTEDSKAYSILSSSITGDYLWFVPRDSAFFFPSRALSRDLPAEFPAILSVTISRHGLTSVTATVADRTPDEIACLDAASSSCYYADDNGVIFESASTTAGAFIVYRLSLPQGRRSSRPTLHR